jgi:hypothetical protein
MLAIPARLPTPTEDGKLGSPGRQLWIGNCPKQMLVFSEIFACYIWVWLAHPNFMKTAGAAKSPENPATA